MNAPCDNKPAVNEQQRLLEVIWSDDPEVIVENGFDVEGIHIYRRNLFANAQQALSISFPTLFELLDSDVSEHICHQFLKSSPPTQGDWTQWGAKLASFIKTTNIAYQYPYLADCAALDWFVHCALHGVDQTFEQSSLQLLGNCEPEQIFITFNYNVKLLETKYPLTDIFQAHHDVDEQQRKLSMNNAQKALAEPPKEQTVMVYRPEFQPKVTTLMPDEGVFMRSLMSGQSLADALNLVSDSKHFSFESWLLKAIERNLIYTFNEN